MDKRKQLEEQRTRVTDFYDCLQEQVDAGIISKEMARQIAQREYPNKTYAQLIDDIDAQVAQLPPPSKRRVSKVHVAALAMVLLLTFGLVWLNGGLTGLFTFSNEEFYNYGFTHTYTSDDITVLPINATISSLRMNGEISGTGKADVWLQSGTQRTLLATFDASAEQSPLTGFVTAVTDLVGITEDNSSANATNGTNGTNTTETPVIEPPQDTNLTGNNTSDVNPGDESSSSDGTTTTNTTSSESVPLTPSTPSQEVPVVPPVRPYSKQFNNDCAQTCTIEDSNGPFMLIVNIQGDAAVRIDSLVYGVLPVEQPAVQTNTTPTEPVTDIGAPKPDSGSTTDTTGTTDTGTNTSTQPETPAGGTTNQDTGGARGSLCSSDSECSSGMCATGRYMGSSVAGRCVPQASYCVTQNGVAAAGSSDGDSKCYSTPAGSIWLASEGNGRYEIRNAGGDTIAIIDKYGNMAVRGNASFSSPAPRDGWMMESKSGTPTLSIDKSGNLVATGMLLQNTRPTPTAGNDFIVKDGSGTVQAVFTENGAVQLAGVFGSNAALE